MAVPEIRLPDFVLDCRQWLVVTEADGVLPEEIGGLPVVAALSTVIVDEQHMHAAGAVLSLGLADTEADVGAELDDGAVGSACLVHADWAAGHARYVLPVPGGELALVAEFSSEPDPHPELINRFHELLGSLRWPTAGHTPHP